MYKNSKFGQFKKRFLFPFSLKISLFRQFRWFMQIYSFSPFGYEGSLVSVEVDLRRGIPATDLVGLADSAVKESRERMQAAIRNSGFDYPAERVLISLSPADLKKEGAGFDLPIALGVLFSQAKNNFSQKDDSPVLVMGELELSGRVRPVKGVHAAASTAAAFGITRCIVPEANCEEARDVSGMKVFGVKSLEDAFAGLENPENFVGQTESAFESSEIPKNCENVDGILFQKITSELEFSEIHGQTLLIKALQVAAAGGHNLIAVGAPGCGKTMAIQKFPALLPLLTVEEAQPVTRIMSLAGLLRTCSSPDRIPPFRMPHQTATIEGICGGGPHCRPGEVSLAHNGVLFLDEASEFRTSVLQMLRVPLENGQITLSRAGRSTVFPARFQLLMAANPCPCGNYGSQTKVCLCSARSIDLFWKKFSSPLLDRVDIRVHVINENDFSDKLEKSEKSKKNESECEPISQRKTIVSTAELRKGIAKAVKNQRIRQGKKNAVLSPSEVAEFCVLGEEQSNILEKAVERYGFSPRAVSSVLKVSRTFADIDGAERIRSEDVKSAIEFRKIDFMDGSL